jgi:hypothetical protein
MSWLFYLSSDTGEGWIALRWRWRAMGLAGEVHDASQAFSTLPACQANAAAHGLTPEDAMTVETVGTDIFCEELRAA